MSGPLQAVATELPFRPTNGQHRTAGFTDYLVGLSPSRLVPGSLFNVAQPRAQSGSLSIWAVIFLFFSAAEPNQRKAQVLTVDECSRKWNCEAVLDVPSSSRLLPHRIPDWDLSPHAGVQGTNEDLARALTHIPPLIGNEEQSRLQRVHAQSAFPGLGPLHSAQL